MALSKRDLTVDDEAKRQAALAARLGYAFKQPALLQQAITHRSFSATHYERLEFLGDSVLNLAVSAMLYERLNDLPEGDLSRVRANLVRQDTLAALADRLQLGACLRLVRVSIAAAVASAHPFWRMLLRRSLAPFT